jgi:hypothetical protein
LDGSVIAVASKPELEVIAMSLRTISRKALAAFGLLVPALCLWIFTDFPGLPLAVAAVILAAWALVDAFRSDFTIRGDLLAALTILIAVLAAFWFSLLWPMARDMAAH